MDKLLNKRESNFELLRIISMLFIVVCHMANNNEYLMQNTAFSISNFIHCFFSAGGKLGVILFILITGYFMVNSKIKIKKIILLELQVLFYSYFLLLLAYFLGKDISINQVVKSLFPNLFKVHWFVSSYFFVYLCIPFLNKLINVMSNKEYKQLLVIGFVFLILIPSLIIVQSPISIFIYLFYYYMVGAYIRLYGDDLKKKYCYFISFIISYLVIIFLTMFFKKLSFNNANFVDYVYFYAKTSSIFMMISSISLFLFFKNLSIGYYKWINRIASFSFGVYIFHDNMFMSRILWTELFCVKPVIHTIHYFGFGVVSAILVYFMASCFDALRQIIFRYFEKIFFRRRCIEE